ncbi:hypothetical protein OAX11_03795 [Flavobacteriaceae bacterium]|jgi:hypothetical protein|nr:hypothetical protein [Flavobacteriaceae bacterium]
MQNLVDGFKSVELEERLEMVHLTAIEISEPKFEIEVEGDVNVGLQPIS